jgi:hypothetical protein
VLSRRRDVSAQPESASHRGQTFCTEGNGQIVIGTENYVLSADGLSMPAKKLSWRPI